MAEGTDIQRILLLTGLSGGGKSTAIRALEDNGWFCIDNLPVVLLPKLLELAARGSAQQSPRLALVIDAREGSYLDAAPAAIDEVRSAGHRLDVLFLDCADEALLRRFSETRRRHPLAPEGVVTEGIAAERALLEPLRRLSDHVIDTTRLTVHELRDTITRRFGSRPDETSLMVTLVSFGFRHGLPSTSDLVLDVRFLPNPYFVAELKEHPGTEPRVSAFVLGQAAAQELLAHLERLLGFLLPQYRTEGKSYLTVAVGCTGGKHRSVALTEELARRLRALGEKVRVEHRDIGK